MHPPRQFIDGKLLCKSCGKLKIPEAYHRDNTAFSGRASSCRLCRNSKRLPKYHLVRHRYALVSKELMPSVSLANVRVVPGYWEEIIRMAILAADEDKCVKINVVNRDKNGRRQFVYERHYGAQAALHLAHRRNPEWKRNFDINVTHDENSVWVALRVRGDARKMRKSMPLASAAGRDLVGTEISNHMYGKSLQEMQANIEIMPVSMQSALSNVESD